MAEWETYTLESVLTNIDKVPLVLVNVVMLNVIYKASIIASKSVDAVLTKHTG